MNFNRYGEQNLEIGFAFVNILLKSIGLGSYTFYLLVTNLCRFLLIAYVSFKLSKYPIVTFLAFYLFNICFQRATLMRQHYFSLVLYL